MFTKTAEFYDALYSFKDYGAACNQLHKLIQKYNPEAKSLLDIACGSGKHITFLREFYNVQGLDLNDELLKVAKKRCPEVIFHSEDMTDFELGESFDVVVCLFSSIGYVRTVENLNKAVQCMADHLSPGGFLLVEPWVTPQQYWKKHIAANFVDEDNLKIAWMYNHEIDGNTSIFNINYLVGTDAGVEHFTEQHIMGLWSHEEYMNAFKLAGITAEHHRHGLFGRGMYTGVKSR